ncbi:anti-sigma factor domain-containing protein [Methylobacterium sp. J-070]|uniref:anti-sigma factor n=1 Tax=Methylobacterium sp. J-070 TaxID=2836650 RepID=UPI001FBBF1FA|nr:anti-sigma factor [Methylobacterium sp. J-070]MCJ2054541.1 anti-sigma factor [Methylobacterium sp. J-070]
MTGTGAPDPDDADLRAAEYVLGTLDLREREAVEREAAGDPVARARIAAWERRLGPLAEAVPAEPPPPRVRAALLRALPKPGGADARQIEALRAQLRRWRTAAGGAGLLAAGLALFLAVGPSLKPADGRYLAVVQGGGTLPALIVRVDTRTGIAQVRRVNAEAPADRSLELWYVGTQGPKPLGLVDAGQSRVRLPAETTPDGVIAVSVEPPGGSPTGQPTGPVVYTGKLIAE